MLTRSLYTSIWGQLSADKPMVMLAGPRQAGKTTFARDIVAKEYPDVVYFNWDAAADKRRLIADPLFFSKEPRATLNAHPLVIFDEIHKYRDWKNYLKGVYDQFNKEYRFLVTGSGRLEFSRKAGDSLAGRFLKFHIFPLTLAEISTHRRALRDFLAHPLEGFETTSARSMLDAFNTLWEVSGFPEPFTKGRKTFWSTWAAAYGQQIVRDDLRTMADIRSLDNVETLFALMPTRVGSPLSMNNLAGDLQVAFDSVKSWLLLFDAFYLTFRLSPWSVKISRSLLKEKKVYLFNFPVIEDSGARFENLVAVELLRAVETWNDRGEGAFSLHYLRNKEKQEVDFLIAENNRPLLLVETKLSAEASPASLLDFQNNLNVPAVVLVKSQGVKKFFKNGKNSILVVSAYQWLSSLP